MNKWEINVFFDGDCPLCLKEINMLKKMDKKKRILFTDIADENFNPENFGKSMDDLMARIHAQLPDGQFIEGVEVFRRLYTAVGFAYIVSLTKIPGISHLLDFGYTVFAKNRLKLTGRCDDKGCEINDATKSVS